MSKNNDEVNEKYDPLSKDISTPWILDGEEEE